MKWSQVSFRKRMLIIMTLSGLIELLLLVAAGFIYVKHAQEEEMGQKALGVAAFLARDHRHSLLHLRHVGVGHHAGSDVAVL